MLQSIKKGRQPDKVIVYWYGESTPKTFYSLVHQSAFVPYEEASIKVRDFAQKALEQHALEKPLSINEAKKYRAWMEMEEDLRKKREERERGETFLFEMFWQQKQQQQQEYPPRQQQHPPRQQRTSTPILHDLAVMDDRGESNPPVLESPRSKRAMGNTGDLVQDDSTLSSGDRSSIDKDIHQRATLNMGSGVAPDAASQQVTDLSEADNQASVLGNSDESNAASQDHTSQSLLLNSDNGANDNSANLSNDQDEVNHDSPNNNDQEVNDLIEALVQKGVSGDDEGLLSKLQSCLIQKQTKIEHLLHQIISLKDSSQREAESIRVQRDTALQKCKALELELARRGEEHRNTVRDLTFERDSAVEKSRELERKIGAARSALGW